MLSYLYLGPHDHIAEDATQSERYEFFMDLYTLAERIELAELASLAAASFEAAANKDWDGGSFLEVCKEVYSRLPMLTVALRKAICAVTVEHLEALAKRKEFQELLEETSSLAAEIALNVGQAMITVKCGYEKCRMYGVPYATICANGWDKVPKDGQACVCCSYRYMKRIPSEEDSN